MQELPGQEGQGRPAHESARSPSLTRLQCDQKRPSCSQCIRAGQECHGYRDILSMMFKNESEVVAKKAEKRYATLAKQKGPKQPPRNDEEPQATTSVEWTDFTDSVKPVGRSETRIIPFTRYPTPESMAKEIVPSIEDQAQSFFVANYVSQPAIVPRGEYDWVTDMMKRPETEESLRLCFNAASLAALANTSKSPEVLQKAQKAYVEALQITNAALRVKESAVRDSTLISVILLGLYENMVFRGDQPMRAWIKHVAGACTLLKLRGKEQFTTIIARHLFHQFYGTILLVALESGLPVHKGMPELYQACSPSSTDYTVHGRQWTVTFVTMIQRTINLDQDNQSDPITMINTAVKIDEDLNRGKPHMPSIWHFDVVKLEKPSEHHRGNFYYVYTDPWIAQMWNNLKCVQIYLYKNMRKNVVRSYKEHDPPLLPMDEVESLIKTTDQLIRAAIDDIIASVPQVTGMIPFPKIPTPKGTATSTPPMTRQLSTYEIHPPGTFLDPSRCPRMIHLIWPMYTIGLLEQCSEEIRQWCVEILQFVALRIGIRQAVFFAEELKKHQKRPVPAMPVTPESSPEPIPSPNLV